jgi:hypothetical protein
MKVLEFKSSVEKDGQIRVPAQIAEQIPAGEPLQIVVLWGASTDDDWQMAGRERFEAAYAPEDSVYEQLINDSPNR